MTIRAKSVIFKKDGIYTVFSKVYDVEIVEAPSHVDLVDKAIRQGFSDKNFMAITTATWNPYTIDIYPDLESKHKIKITKLVKEDIKRILDKTETKRLLKEIKGQEK